MSEVAVNATEQNTKECPQCAETIKSLAKVCRFCSHDMSEPEEEKVFLESPARVTSKRVQFRGKGDKADSVIRLSDITRAWMAEDYLERIETTSQGTRRLIRGFSEDTFKADIRTQKAVTLSILELGQAIDRMLVSDPSLLTDNDSPTWGEIRGIRDQATLNLLDVDLHVVWLAATTTIPELGNQASNLLDDLASDPGLSPN